MGLFAGNWYEVMPFDGWDSFVNLDLTYELLDGRGLLTGGIDDIVD